MIEVRTVEDVIDDLRIRATIRRKDTCRGPEDRLSNQLDEAADILEMYHDQYGELDDD